MNKPKKKKFLALEQVKAFIATREPAVIAEYRALVRELETDGFLSMPHGEKMAGENLFAIRVIRAGNVRVFYLYGLGDLIYGIYGYVKKTQRIPDCEMKQAKRIIGILKQKGMIK